jgi:zinc protease
MKRRFLASFRGWLAGVALSSAACLGTAWAALPIEHWVHDSGARVYLVHTPVLPMLDVQVDVDGGSRRDPPAQAGLAAATALMLGKGVEARGADPALEENDLAEAWADLGAQFSAQASADRMSFRLRTLTQPDLLQPAVALAARQLAAPAFPAVIWARERERLVAAWRQAQTQPGTLAERRFAQAVYGSHPYGFEARPDTWSVIDATTLRAFYRRHARACDARVTLVGAVDRVQADRLVGQLMEGWRSHGCDALPSVPDVAPLERAWEISEPYPAAQAQVFVGQPGMARSDPDFLALTVGNHILGGGGFTSRLMREIREKRGLTYGVYSYFSPGRHAGAFTVGMQTRPDQAAQAVALIHEELQRFVQEGPGEQELADAKASLVNGFALRLDSNRKLLDNVAALAWNDLPLDYLDTWTRQVGAITREQVRVALQRILQPDRMVTVVVGGAP